MEEYFVIITHRTTYPFRSCAQEQQFQSGEFQTYPQEADLLSELERHGGKYARVEKRYRKISPKE